MVRRMQRLALICAVSGFVLARSMANAQATSSQFTPQSLRLETRRNARPLNAWGPSAITMPAGDNRLTVLISRLDVEGAFAAGRFQDRIVGRRVSMAEIYQAAADLAQIYLAAGYPLVRVVVPPQRLVDQGRLRFVVDDGIIEAIDEDRVPSRVRRSVLKLAAIERAVLVASGGAPMMRPEQISLDGSDALSAFPFGTFNADQGVTLRGELSRPYVFGAGAFNLTASPYVFGAAGRGWLANATRIEQAAFDAATIGVGIRGGVDTAGWPSATVGLEIARGFTDLAGVRQGVRINLVAATAF